MITASANRPEVSKTKHPPRAARRARSFLWLGFCLLVFGFSLLVHDSAFGIDLTSKFPLTSSVRLAQATPVAEPKPAQTPSPAQDAAAAPKQSDPPPVIPSQPTGATPAPSAPPTLEEPPPLPQPTNTPSQNPLLPDASAVKGSAQPSQKPVNNSPSPAAPANTGIPFDTPTPVEPPSPADTAASYFGVQALRAGELPNTTPAARAARNEALTDAEAMLDGVGGIPASLRSVQETDQLNTSRRRFRIGPINIIGPSLNAAVTGQNFRQQGNASGSSITQEANNNSSGFQSIDSISLGMMLGKIETGHYLLLQYGAAYQYPATLGRNNNQGSDQQPFTQQLTILGELDFSKLRLGLGISFASLSGTNRDLGGSADRQLLNVSLTSSYALTQKTSLDWDLNVPVTQVSGGIGSDGFTNSIMLNHVFDEKFTLGLGFVFGEDKQQESGSLSSAISGLTQSGPTQKFQQALIEFGLVPSPRITLSGQVGLEFRDAGGSHSTNPMFRLNAVWTPRTGTSFYLTGSEQTQTSASLLNENFLSTSVALGASQRLGNRMTLLLSVGYEHASYQSAHTSNSPQSNANSNRVDDLFTLQAGLNVMLNRGWSLSASYSYGVNKSTSDGFTSSIGQISLGYTF